MWYAETRSTWLYTAYVTINKKHPANSIQYATLVWEQSIGNLVKKSHGSKYSQPQTTKWPVCKRRAHAWGLTAHLCRPEGEREFHSGVIHPFNINYPWWVISGRYCPRRTLLNFNWGGQFIKSYCPSAGSIPPPALRLPPPGAGGARRWEPCLY